MIFIKLTKKVIKKLLVYSYQMAIGNHTLAIGILKNFL